jgi:hypothetical protein
LNYLSLHSMYHEIHLVLIHQHLITIENYLMLNLNENKFNQKSK